jgi:predicted RNA methylase
MQNNKERPTVSKEELRSIILDSEKLGYKYKNCNDTNKLRVLHHIERYKLIAQIINSKNEKVSILDVGVGNGLCLEVLCNTCQKLIKDVGIVEIELDVLEQAKEIFSNAMSFQRIEEINEKFDIVICHEVIGNKSISCDIDFVEKLKNICNKILSLSIPNYGNTHHNYFTRTYSVSSFNNLLKTCFSKNIILKYSQIHPFERNNIKDIGVWENPGFEKPCDFMMGVVYL